MASQAELRDQKNESLATKFVRHSFYTRIAITTIGFIMSCILIFMGYDLTQQSLIIQNINSEVNADFGVMSFALKNTTPGVILIICGTAVAITTILRQSFTKSQWSDSINGIPGYTETKG